MWLRAFRYLEILSLGGSLVTLACHVGTPDTVLISSSTDRPVFKMVRVSFDAADFIMNYIIVLMGNKGAKSSSAKLDND